MPIDMAGFEAGYAPSTCQSVPPIRGSRNDFVEKPTVVDGVEPEPGKVSKARLQFDAYRWHAGKLAPKKYGDRISHDVKGGGINFQPQILISCSSAGEEQEYIDVSAAPEAADSLPQQGNGNSLPGSGGRR